RPRGVPKARSKRTGTRLATRWSPSTKRVMPLPAVLRAVWRFPCQNLNATADRIERPPPGGAQRYVHRGLAGRPIDAACGIGSTPCDAHTVATPGADARCSAILGVIDEPTARLQNHLRGPAQPQPDSLG